jgi:hypothetical protein
MPEFDVIKPWDLKRITKGKIGEWIARDYYRNKGYVVWFLESYYHGSFYSGTGKEHVNDRLILTPLEKAVLENTRAFDLLIVREEDVRSMKGVPVVESYYNSLRILFTVIVRENGLKSLKEYLDLDLNEKIKFVKSKIEEIVNGGIRENARPDVYNRQQFKFYGRRLLMEQDGIKKALVEMENRHAKLKGLKRLLIDVKTKWSEYDYPEGTKNKDSELIEVLKILGFKCTVLEIEIVCPEIRLTSMEL